MKLTGKILIVDDDKMIREFFENTLVQLGFKVATSEDGLDALDKIKEGNFDLILLDNVMPKLSGYEVTQILKKDREFESFKDLPIIMFSALDDTENKIMGLEMGVDDYISKPFNFSEVLARIRSIFRHREVAKQLANREKRLAILESLNTNLIAVKNHIKEPMNKLYEEAMSIDFCDNEAVKTFLSNFKNDYKELQATLKAIESEIDDLEIKGRSIKQKEVSLEEMEKKILSNLSDNSQG